MLVYLIRIDDETVKVGMSSKSDLRRCLSYGKSAKFLLISDIGNAYLLVEKNLIKKFKENYKIAKGREYFLCNEDGQAKELFLQCIPINQKNTNPFQRFAFTGCSKS